MITKETEEIAFIFSFPCHEGDKEEFKRRLTNNKLMFDAFLRKNYDGKKLTEKLKEYFLGPHNKLSYNKFNDTGHMFIPYRVDENEKNLIIKDNFLANYDNFPEELKKRRLEEIDCSPLNESGELKKGDIVYVHDKFAVDIERRT